MNDARHSSNFPPLTAEQICDLAASIREVFGSDLPRESFTDKLLMFLEDVPGYETGRIPETMIDSAWDVVMPRRSRTAQGR